MAQTFDSLYETSATNSAINAAASEFFFSTNFDKQSIQKIGQSFNSLEINNDDSTTDLDIDLDGLATRRRRIFAKTSFFIGPEEGVFFNTVKVTNVHASSATGAGKVKLNARILKERR